MFVRPRQIAIFLCIVLVPLAIAAWLGLKVARDEQQVGRHQFQSLLEGRLRDVDSTIARLIQDIERQFVDQILPTTIDDTRAPALFDELRRLRRTNLMVREVFVLDKEGGLTFPPNSADASPDERSFRQRTDAIWRGRAVLYEPPATASGDERTQVQGPERSPSTSMALIRPGSEATPTLAEQGDTVLALAEHRLYGWISWYWAEGMHLLFWRRTDEGHVIGVEVERIALLARIIAKLPAAGLDDGRVVLIDSRGHPMHQWGPYEPTDGQTAAARSPVTYPLHAWRLLHYASPAQTKAFLASSLRLNLILGFVALAVALLAMAFMFYRDYARRMRDAAQRVNFVTQVSHELKTPLTNIRLYAELLDTELDEDDERGHKRLSVIIAESQRLTRLINNILAFSRNRKNRLEANKSLIHIDDVVASVLEQFAPALAARDIETVFTPGADTPIHSDADAVGQIVANLVSNVEKYAADGKYLRVSTHQSAHSTSVRVSDRGPGIPVTHGDKVFRPFYRVSDKLTDGVTGTGIGLSIARELARLSGGRLSLVPSERGTCFELTLDRTITNDEERA